MLQLTFHGQLPGAEELAFVHTQYAALQTDRKTSHHGACLIVTFAPPRDTARSCHRVVFECADARNTTTKVITESASVLAALRSGFAVLHGLRPVRALAAE